jgi:hypothetical protein
LLTDNNTSYDFIFQHISTLEHSNITRYLISENKKYTLNYSYLYKILKNEKININKEIENGHLEIVKYLYNVNRILVKKQVKIKLVITMSIWLLDMVV